MLMTGMLTCALLLINALLVKAFLLTSNLERMDVRISQAAQFVMPIAMIFVQFWVFDLMTLKRNNRRIEADADTGGSDS